ncbi:hypothetical protein ACT691_02165 [Vibrio metschnikovii]
MVVHQGREWTAQWWTKGRAGNHRRWGVWR